MVLIRRIFTTIRLKPWSGAILPFAVLVGVAVLVFYSQNRVVGFEPGYNALQAGFHGSVSSRTLAIISHATPANGFVGYVFQTLDENGKKDYDYFDRYPVFFSAGMHVLLSLKTKLSTQIYLAKQAMNVIFLLTLVAAYLLARLLVRHWALGLAAVLFSVSSQYLLFYKDMIHFDQPALLGIVFLIYAIAVHMRRPESPPIVWSRYQRCCAWSRVCFDLCPGGVVPSGSLADPSSTQPAHHVQGSADSQARFFSGYVDRRHLGGIIAGIQRHDRGS